VREQGADERLGLAERHAEPLGQGRDRERAFEGNLQSLPQEGAHALH
jgi:hypothetical protein